MSGVTTLERPADTEPGVPERFPAITIRPPWAWCIAAAETLTALGVTPKLVENRGRPVAEKWVGLDWAVHAGTRWDRDGAEDWRVQHAWRRYWDRPLEGRPVHTDSPTGAVVAVARLVGCHQAELDGCGNPCCRPWGEPWWETGRGVDPAWHLVWANVRKLLRPVPVRGQLPVPWLLPPDLAAKVAAQLEETKQREEQA